MEGYGSNGGRDNRYVRCGGVSTVWWRRVKNMDFEGRLTSENKLAQLHHGNQVADLGRWEGTRNAETKMEMLRFVNPTKLWY